MLESLTRSGWILRQNSAQLTLNTSWGGQVLRMFERERRQSSLSPWELSGVSRLPQSAPEGASDYGSKGGHGPSRVSITLEPTPGCDPETESSFKKRQPPAVSTTTACGARPLSPLSSSPAKGSPLGEEGGEAVPCCFSTDHTQLLCRCRMWSYLEDDWHYFHRGDLVRIQHASSETSVENVKATPSMRYILLLKI